MLTSRYKYSLDAKNRLFIPAKHREQLGEAFIITKNVDKSLSVYSAEEWTNYTSKLKGLPPTKARKLARFLFSNAIEVQPDQQGRVVITSDLLEYAGIQKGVYILGCGAYCEIWAAEKYEETYGTDDSATIEELMLELEM